MCMFLSWMCLELQLTMACVRSKRRAAPCAEEGRLRSPQQCLRLPAQPGPAFHVGFCSFVPLPPAWGA